MQLIIMNSMTYLEESVNAYRYFLCRLLRKAEFRNSSFFTLANRYPVHSCHKFAGKFKQTLKLWLCTLTISPTNNNRDSKKCNEGII